MSERVCVFIRFSLIIITIITIIVIVIVITVIVTVILARDGRLASFETFFFPSGIFGRVAKRDALHPLPTLWTCTVDTTRHGHALGQRHQADLDPPPSLAPATRTISFFTH